MKIKIVIALLIALTLAPCFQGYAGSKGHSGYVVRDGRLIERRYVATMSKEGHLEAAQQAFDQEDWQEAAYHFNVVASNFCDAKAQEAYYYLGIASYNMEEYDAANDAFSNYLKAQNHPTYFEEAVLYKFYIAQALRCGAKRRFFGSRKSPKWADGSELALTIYDEVIASIPCHEAAVQSLYYKGLLLRSMKEYRESIESLRVLVRRFPKHELAPESYLMMTQVYLEQSQFECQNPDLLALAEISLKRFKEEFPREERIAAAECNILSIKECYANSLYEMGRFYERIGKPQASLLYYRNAMQKFPETSIVELCESRLQYLDGCYPRT